MEYMDVLKKLKPIFWENENLQPAKEAFEKIQYTLEDVLDAEKRLMRFSKYFMKVYPETRNRNGIIESDIHECKNIYGAISDNFNTSIKNKIMLKKDSHLPISGSVKARGGVYEVIKHAETLAIENGLLNLEDDYSIFADDKFKKFFGQYSMSVGSTGNLGLSIGIVGADLGFNVYVHMSSDAKQWKKDMLRSKGVHVIEYKDDYCAAVENGRKQAQNNPMMHFVDDENSVDLFLGYSVAALRLKRQLDDLGYKFDDTYKLRVYLPCGIGGAPGGITFGLKLVFGDYVDCYFAEPTHAPCMTLGLMMEQHDEISVYDIGIDGKTKADGLAVARASKFAGKTVENLVSGCYTIDDNSMYKMLYLLKTYEDVSDEPSAAAAFFGPMMIPENKHCLHLCWLTGGNMVPDDVMQKFISKGRELCSG